FFAASLLRMQERPEGDVLSVVPGLCPIAREKKMIANLLLSVVGFLLTVSPTSAPSPDYRVLAPIRHGNLTVFPVVTAIAHDTREFLTLDEGLRSGEVVVRGAGRVSTMIRRPTPRAVPHYPIQEAQVNRLVLVNNSKRPLLL